MVKAAFFRELARMGEESLALEGPGSMNCSIAHCVRTNLWQSQISQPVLN